MTCVAIGIFRPSVVSPSQEAVITIRHYIPTDPTSLDRRREHEVVRDRRVTAYVYGGRASGGGPCLLLGDGRFLSVKERIIVQQSVQFLMPIAGVSDLPAFIMVAHDIDSR